MTDPRKELVTYGRMLHRKGFVAASDGNLSARLPLGGFVVTPTGTPKVELQADLLVELDTDGRAKAGTPSSEWPMHMAAYRVKPEAGAVVHAHPPFATALASTGRAIDRPLLSEAVVALGNVPLVPFALPSTAALAEAAAEQLRDHEAVLLANHGAVTVGPDVRTAYYRMETLELTATILVITEILGGGSPLPEATVKSLRSMGSRYSLAPLPAPACEGCPVASGKDGVYFDREGLVKLLVEFGRFTRTGDSSRLES